MATTTAPEGTALGYLIEATQEVFQTMILSELTIGVPIDGDALRPRSNVVATVSFAGPRSGIVALYTTLSTAQTLAAAMLGGTVDEQEQLADAIGELANMVAGTFRNHMAKDGSCWAISMLTTRDWGNSANCRVWSASSITRIRTPGATSNTTTFCSAGWQRPSSAAAAASLTF